MPDTPNRPPLWREIPGYEGLYEISDSGIVRSIERLIVRSRNGVKPVPQKIKKPTLRKDGYLRVNLWKGCQRRTFAVHRLVLMAFVGFPPEGHEACHANGIRADNRLENLRWDTKKANYADARAHGTCTTGERNGRAKLTREQAAEIRASTLSYSQLASAYGVSRAAVHYIKSNRGWKEVAV